ncbi:MAG TPA: hypothetical protein VMW47_09705 [Verrucomicrobiae bacterium]|nr:hypothetical protein [Verrucomicrobiae bacterium]
MDFRAAVKAASDGNRRTVPVGHWAATVVFTTVSCRPGAFQQAVMTGAVLMVDWGCTAAETA